MHSPKQSSLSALCISIQVVIECEIAMNPHRYPTRLNYNLDFSNTP